MKEEGERKGREEVEKCFELEGRKEHYKSTDPFLSSHIEYIYHILFVIHRILLVISCKVEITLLHTEMEICPLITMLCCLSKWSLVSSQCADETNKACTCVPLFSLLECLST